VDVSKKLLELSPDIAGLPFVVSPLARARETAEIVRRGLGVPAGDYALDDRIREISYGEWEGRTWKEVRRDFPAEAQEHKADKWNYRPPRGESYAMLAQRAAPAIDALPETSVVVSHGGIARVLLHLLAGMPEEEAPAVDIWQGRVLVFADIRHRWH
jgi:probable phosphoglycerate mutase